MYPKDFNSGYIKTTSLYEQLMLETQKYARYKEFAKFQV
jgi:hypothetical protein